MELGPQNHNGDGLLGPNSIMVVCMDPLGYLRVGALHGSCAAAKGRRSLGTRVSRDARPRRPRLLSYGRSSQKMAPELLGFRV